LPSQEFSTFEVTENTTHVPGIQPKYFADVSCSRVVLVGELVKDASFCERERAAGSTVQDTNLASVKAVEGTESSNLRGDSRCRHGGLLILDRVTHIVDNVNFKLEVTDDDR